MPIAEADENIRTVLPVGAERGSRNPRVGMGESAGCTVVTRTLSVDATNEEE
jgi:hypothetical protein